MNAHTWHFLAFFLFILHSCFCRIWKLFIIFFASWSCARNLFLFFFVYGLTGTQTDTHTHTLMYRYTGTLLLEMGPNMFMSSRNIYNHYQPHLTHTHIRPDLLGYLKTSGHIRVLTFERPHALTYSVDVARDTHCVCVKGLNVIAINKTEISLFLRRENVAERST